VHFGIAAQLVVLGVLIKLHPNIVRRSGVAALRQNLCRHRLHEKQRSRLAAANQERLRGAAVVLQVPIVDKAQVLPESPISGVIHDPAANEFERRLRLARALRWLLGEENRSEAVSNEQMRIELRGDAEERS